MPFRPDIRDAEVRLSTLANLIYSLPEQHFATLKVLMLHLHRWEHIPFMLLLGTKLRFRHRVAYIGPVSIIR